jgi:hypothetical protein
MEPGAAPDGARLGIGHNLTPHGSEAGEVRTRGALATPRALAYLIEAYAFPTTSVSLPSSAWWLSSPQ